MILIAIQVIDQLTNCLVKNLFNFKEESLLPLFLFFNVHSDIKIFFSIEGIFEAPFLEVISTKLLLGSCTFFVLC